MTSMKNHSVFDNPLDELRQYVVNPEIPIHNPKLYVLPREPKIERMYFTPPGAAGTSLIAERDPFTGQIIDFTETKLQNPESNAQNSISLRRAPVLPEKSIRGSNVNCPFWPGGFDEPIDDIESVIQVDSESFEKILLNVPPELMEWATNVNLFESKNPDAATVDDVVEEESKNINNNIINLLNDIEQEQTIFGLWNCGDSETVVKTIDKKILISDNEQSIWQHFEDKPILAISKTGVEPVVKLQWAETVDVSKQITDFEKLIPNPARKYPFELDIFQKQAILKLEEHQHVFVAAHTSAGKTVVAEYAIALSQKHMTRSIYTSPIKALSNQKYRDFKNIFKDVGLITGDIQIDSTSSCLIMTTEILRSMLYCGSEVTRDLEYVIFDEVHYITDPERGHVWEEVLILLPDHVHIVMLSATVPNTLEFANWVGQIKKRKVYVISTLKRPIPLMHHLYTGCGGKSKNDIFLLVNESGEFSIKGYRDAVNAKANSTKQSQPAMKLNLKQEQQLWIGFVDHLKRNDKLPVVAFTLSRKRCDGNLKALQSCDLCTAREAHYIQSFYQKCISKLKPIDRDIPQVILLQDSLKRGIGVHHSGILPILKEIVEILFQMGYVKLLFATETFAMGVNMPARTVVFDAHTKFDGIESRLLRPAEYIQMAGRAGRRGLDKTGTVILLCKTKVPIEQDLRTIMLGKPMRLESKFRLTYAMILNLLRVESVTVEDMMSHSFKEFNSQTKIVENQAKLKIAEEQISTMQDLSEHLIPYSKFFDIAFDYVEHWNEFMNNVIIQPKMIKELKPGRVLIISYSHHYNKVGILLSANNLKKEQTFTVLVLDHQNVEEEDSEINIKLNDEPPQQHQLQPKNDSQNLLDRGELWHSMIGLTLQHKHFLPEGGIGGHCVLQVKSSNIIKITKTILKIEADKLLQNWEQRQIPRFRGTPPGPTFMKSVLELYNLNADNISGTNKLQFLNLKKDLNININVKTLNVLKQKLTELLPCTKVPNFQEEFKLVFDRKQLERKREDLKFKISRKSLSLYPDYMNKLKVLQQLNYIDDQHEVTMKGRVACEMGSNELIITELVLCNTFTDLDSAEIAALLSCLVFQAKTEAKPKLTESLKKCVETIKNVDLDIIKVEKMFNVSTQDESIEKDRLNFGLIEVVYEWARNKPFAQIMELIDDIQEGVVVRCIQQLNETIQHVKDAARIIGNPALHQKMEDASNSIKRDIVFTASLYFDT